MASTDLGRRAGVHGQLYRVCWESSVTRVQGRSAPMSRDQAEFLAHDEAIGTASCRFWIEPLESAIQEDDSGSDHGILARRATSAAQGEAMAGSSR